MQRGVERVQGGANCDSKLPSAKAWTEAEEVALGRVGPCFRGEDAGLECRSVPAGGGPELRQLLDLGPRAGALLRARTGRGAVGAGGLVRVHDVGAASAQAHAARRRACVRPDDEALAAG